MGFVESVPGEFFHQVKDFNRQFAINTVFSRAFFEGAALATGSSVLIEENTPAYYSLISNPVLADLAHSAYERIGRPVTEEPITGSTDMGNVSHVVPSIHPMIQLIPGGVTHTREFAEAADGPNASATIADGARMLAATALAVFREPSLAAEAKHAFDAR